MGELFFFLFRNCSANFFGKLCVITIKVISYLLLSYKEVAVFVSPKVACPHFRFYNHYLRTTDNSTAQIYHCQLRFNDLQAPLRLLPLKYRLVISYTVEWEIHHVTRHV